MEMTSDDRELDKIYKRRDRYEIPEWQRGAVWNRRKKQALIDSILRDWKLPKFYFLRTSDDPEAYKIVDGQQRLTAIFEFFSNELPLSVESAEFFGGRYYRDLPEKCSDQFDDFKITFDVIDDADEENPDVKEFFQRLQQGLPLTGSEKLNATHSQLTETCRTLAEHNFFQRGSQS